MPAVTPAPLPGSLPAHDDSTSNDTITREFFHSTCPISQPASNKRVDQCLFLSSLFYLSSTLRATVKSIFNHSLLKTCTYPSSHGPTLMKLTFRTTISQKTTILLYFSDYVKEGTQEHFAFLIREPGDLCRLEMQYSYFCFGGRGEFFQPFHSFVAFTGRIILPHFAEEHCYTGIAHKTFSRTAGHGPEGRSHGQHRLCRQALA